MFHFHSLLIHFSVYIVTLKGFSKSCNSNAYSILLTCAGSMLYAIPNLLDIYTIDAHLIYFQFCNLTVVPSLLKQCYIFMQYLFVIYSSYPNWLFHGILLYSISFFCIYNFRTKSQFHVKWIYRNKFIIIIIIIIIITIKSF